MEEKNLQNEIDFIKKIMNDSRVVIVDDGKDFIFWGIIVTIGLVLTYIAIVTGWAEYDIFVWLTLVAVGWAFSILRHFKAGSKRRASSLAGKMLGGIWASTGIASTIFGFVGPIAGAYHPAMISPMISMVLGCAFFTSGIIYGKKWLSGLAAGWWTGAIFIFFFPYAYSLLVMAGMMLFLQITPGIILFRKSKAQFLKEI